jgi:TM2 domain
MNKFCPHCGAINQRKSSICLECGKAPNSPHEATSPSDENAKISPKSEAVLLILLIFFGWAGLHRIYIGRMGSGILYLCTFGLFTLGAFFDLYLIIAGKFTDSNGLPIRRS